MNVHKNIENAAILTPIKTSKSFHGRFTANFPKFPASHSFHSKMRYNFTPTFFFKDFQRSRLIFQKILTSTRDRLMNDVLIGIGDFLRVYSLTQNSCHVIFVIAQNY